jgi:colanic acid/amylovoran biosynthesis protein
MFTPCKQELAKVRILVDHGCYELLNMGDVAMLQACVKRLRLQWPDAEIMVIARAPEDLAPHCPGTMPIRRATTRSLECLLPVRYQPVWRSVAPYIAERVRHSKSPSSLEPTTVVEAVRAADIVVAAGGGYLTDTWRWHATGVLSVLGLAQRLGKPTAMFGQGIGPLEQRLVRMQACAVLPRLAALGLREGRVSLDLAISLGAPPSAVTVTGDDALELLDGTTTVNGAALGINMRVSHYAGVDPAATMVIGDVVRAAAEAWQAPILGLPVSRHGADDDLDAIRGMLNRGSSRVDIALHDLGTPSDLIVATGTCRSIVTGSYHTAVFALGQGVPTVCITNSAYYDAKFAGLRALFPGICFMTALHDTNFGRHLRAGIDQAMQLPAQARTEARAAAAELRHTGRSVYQRFHEGVEQKSMAVISRSEG